MAISFGLTTRLLERRSFTQPDSVLLADFSDDISPSILSKLNGDIYNNVCYKTFAVSFSPFERPAGSDFALLILHVVLGAYMLSYILLWSASYPHSFGSLFEPL